MYRTLHQANLKLREQAGQEQIQLKEGISIKWGTLHDMLKEFFPKTEHLDWNEALTLLDKLLIAHAKRDLKATIVELGYGDKTFTPEQVVGTFHELAVEMCLRSYPHIFEEMPDGSWRSKEKVSA